jgi:hypothetical protein
MKDFINHILALYGKLTVTTVISVISLVSAWLFRRRRKEEGVSIMGKIVAFFIATSILGFTIGATILAEIAHRWKKGKWSGEYLARLREAVDPSNKFSRENRRLMNPSPPGAKQQKR